MMALRRRKQNYYLTFSVMRNPADLIADSDNDGIPDSRDSGDKTNILPSLAGLFTSGLLEIEAGLVFGLGDTAFTAGKGQAKVTMADVNNVGQPGDIGFAYPSGLFGFRHRRFRGCMVSQLISSYHNKKRYRQMQPTVS